MGLRDYEIFSTTIESNGKSRLENMIENEGFLYKYMKYCLPNTLGEAVNRHCFKFSRLRDEIFCVKCYLTRVDNSTEPNLYYFFVNEKSFWNRFSIFLKNDPNSFLTKNTKLTAIDVLKKITDNPNIVDNCYINLFQYEIRKKDQIYNAVLGTEKEEIHKANVENGSLCKIVDFTNYNKRIWYEILSQTIKDPTSESGFSDLTCDFGSYKDDSSDMFYNPNDENYRDIMLMYL
jgi:hypothetical protein